MLPCVLVALILIAPGNHVYSQSYTTALGIRLGGTTGLTVKHSYRPTMTFEGIVGGFPNGFSLTGLIEKNRLAFNEPGLNWYYGGGGHVAVYNSRTYYGRFGREFDYSTNNEVGFGIDGIVGLEYRLPDNVPIAFSVDLKPFLEITTGGNAGLALDPSIGIKFIIK
jgi:hypothetical protein